jgi:septal ring factor EnvC (AmiA/AmiB activator)
MATKTARREELQREIGELDKRIREVRDESMKFDQSLEHNRREFAKLQERHTQACRREALGERSDRAAIAVAIDNASAKIKGLEILVSEKQAEVTRLRAETDPIGRELAEIARQEELERQRGEVQELFKIGKAAVLDYLRAEKEFAELIARLRGYADPAVQSVGCDAALALESARIGRRIHEVFSPEELRELV